MTIFKVLGRPEDEESEKWVLGVPFFREHVLSFNYNDKKVQIDGLFSKVEDPFASMTLGQFLIMCGIILFVVVTFVVVSVICLKRDEKRRQRLLIRNRFLRGQKRVSSRRRARPEQE